MKELINNINKDIVTAEDHENESTIGLITSVGLGIAGVVFTKNSSGFWLGTSLVSNFASGVSNSYILFDSKDTKKKLIKIRTDAEKQQKEIKVEIDNLISILSELEKGRLKKFKVNIGKNTKKNIK